VKGIRLLSGYPPYNAQEVVGVADLLAERLVSQGIATPAAIPGVPVWTPNAVLGAQLLRDFRAGSAESMRLQREGGFGHSL
jgi:hypothetical protein